MLSSGLLLLQARKYAGPVPSSPSLPFGGMKPELNKKNREIFCALTLRYTGTEAGDQCSKRKVVIASPDNGINHMTDIRPKKFELS
jgi:hypothetical protein